MKKRTKHILLLLLADASILPGCLLCRFLTTMMLATDRPCAWTYFGGKCLTCGGTHFVQSLVQGKFGDAFLHNQFLFILTVALAISYVLLHLAVFLNLDFAKKLLKKIYSIPGLVVACVGIIVFIIVRNLPMYANVCRILFNMIRSWFA